MRRISGRHAVGFACGLVTTILIVVPTLAVPFSAMVDRGVHGRPRLTVFHVALALSDDSVIELVRNSVVLATIVTVLATVLGVGLGRLAAGPRFLGRDVLLALTRAPGTVPPLFTTVGMLGVLRLVPLEAASTWRWIALGWVELAWAVPWVMAATTESFEAVEPAWVDAARLAGAKTRRARAMIGWPLARGHVGRAVATVFTLTLFEPGAPLVLGLRRTLPVGLIEAALGFDREPRAAVLAVIGLAAAFAVRAVIVAWAGPRAAIPPANARSNRSSLASFGAVLSLTFWACVTLMPIAGLLAMALGLDRSGRFRLDGLFALATNPRAIAGLRDSVSLGLGATVIAAFLGWGLSGTRSRWWLDPASWPANLPPLALGLGAILVPNVLDNFAAMGRTPGGTIPTAAHALADLFDPYRVPWLVLILTTATLQIPTLRAAFAESRSRDDGDALDVARTLGASRWRAWLTIAAPSVVATLTVAFSITFVRSAIAAAPALVLSRTMEARPVAVVIADLSQEPDGFRGASVLAFVALIFPILSWIVAGSRRSARSRLVQGPREPLC